MIKIITISREYGSGGRLIGNSMIRKLLKRRLRKAVFPKALSSKAENMLPLQPVCFLIFLWATILTTVSCLFITRYSTLSAD